MQDRQRCPLCQRNGIHSYLRSYQINLDEAVALCENKKCIYPVGLSPDSDGGTFSRTLSEVTGDKISVPRVPSAQLSLQTQVAPHLLEYGQKVQRAALSTQTCSPLSTASLLLNTSHQPESRIVSVVGSKGSNSNCKKTVTPEFAAFRFGDQNCNGSYGLESLLDDIQVNKSRENSMQNVLQADDKVMKSRDVTFSHKLAPSPIDPICNDKTSICNQDNKFSNSNVSRNPVNGKSDCLAGCKDGNCCCKDHLEPEIFPQWLNKDALCWLDVVLCLLVHNGTVRKAVHSGKISRNCVIYKLVKAHEQVKSILNTKCEQFLVGKSISPHHQPLSAVKINQSPVENLDGIVEAKNMEEMDGVQKGAGLGLSENRPEISHTTGLDLDPEDRVKMQGVMDKAREGVWESLKSRLKCKRGQKDSPVFAMPLLLQQSQEMEKLFSMSYRFFCPKCKHEDGNEYKNTLPTFPSVLEDFTMQEPRHKRACFRCGQKSGIRTMKYKRLSSCLLMHFVEGLPNIPWSKLQFSFHGNTYMVTGMVQYINNPDHFIAWLRNPSTNSWAKCDDLDSLVCRFDHTEPCFPVGQVHMVMWERVQSHHPIVNGIRKGRNLGDISRKLVDITKTSVIRSETCQNLKMTDSGVVGNCSSCCRNLKSEKCFNCRLQNIPKQNRTTNKIPYSGAQIAMFSGAKASENHDKHAVMLPAVTGAQQIDEIVATKGNALDSSCSTPCSSLSSYSDTSTESVHLPMFTMSTQENCGLVKPVPCKMDVLGLKSNCSGANALCSSSETCGNNDEKGSSDTLFGKFGHAVSVLRMVKGGRGKRSNSSDCLKAYISDKSKVDLVQTENKHSSAFQAAPKTACKKANRVYSRKNSKTDNMSLSVNSVAGTPAGPVVTPKIKFVSSSIPGHVSNTSSSISVDSKFKLPSCFKKPAFNSNVSKDAFRTLSRGASSGTDGSSDSLTEGQVANSPSLGGTGTYLSAVKQYLIGKTTGSSEAKSKFEGLNLRSAPQLKRSTNLTSLQLKSSCSSVISGGSPLVSLTDNTETNVTSTVNIPGSLTRKRTSNLTNTSCPKVSRKATTDSLSIKNSVGSQNSISSISTLAKIVGGTRNASVRKQSGNNIKLVRKMNAETSESGKSFSVYGYNSQSLKETRTGEIQVHDGTQHAFGKECNSDDTETVLQDLYQALNIPFKAVPETMSDIMMDVDDILGLVDTCRLAPEQDVSPTGTGNKASLDCADPDETAPAGTVSSGSSLFTRPNFTEAE